MSLVNRCSMLSMDDWLKSIASMAMRGEKLGGDLLIGQPTGWGCSRESFFLGSSGICLTPLSQRERLPCTACRERIHVVCIRFLLYDVQQFESP
jgi:hypothetical protein